MKLVHNLSSTEGNSVISVLIALLHTVVEIRYVISVVCLETTELHGVFRTSTASDVLEIDFTKEITMNGGIIHYYEGYEHDLYKY
jgi:hypothetical protein